MSNMEMMAMLTKEFAPAISRQVARSCQLLSLSRMDTVALPEPEPGDHDQYSVMRKYALFDTYQTTETKESTIVEHLPVMLPWVTFRSSFELTEKQARELSPKPEANFDLIGNDVLDAAAILAVTIESEMLVGTGACQRAMNATTLTGLYNTGMKTLSWLDSGTRLNPGYDLIIGNAACVRKYEAFISGNVMTHRHSPAGKMAFIKASSVHVKQSAATGAKPVPSSTGSGSNSRSRPGPAPRSNAPPPMRGLRGPCGIGAQDRAEVS